MSIEGLIGVLVWLVIIGLIFYVLWWALGQFNLPEPANKVVRVLLVLIFALIIIGFLLQLAGPMPRLLR